MSKNDEPYSDELNDQISDYVQERLHGKELEEFESRLKEDKKLADRVFSEASLKYGVVYSNRLAMKRRLDEIDKLDDVDSKNQINNPLEDGPF